MLVQAIKNTLFCLASIGLLTASIAHDCIINSHMPAAASLYPSPLLGVVNTSLFLNVCFVIFALIIHGNLNDFLLRRAINMIGAHQKLRVLGILVTANSAAYTGINVYRALLCAGRIGREEELLLGGFLVVQLFAAALLVSVSAIHPDLFGCKWRKEMRMYRRGLLSRGVFI